MSDLERAFASGLEELILDQPWEAVGNRLGISRLHFGADG
jgi:hypothetical protein